MLEQLIKLYTASMMQDVRSPIPHLAGPPGTNKSGVAQQLANLVGKKLHIVNVARLSPLEIEGLQMPIEENTRLKMLINRLWMDLEEGDIVFFDEFMRGFPEVYNGLLDIVTSRHVAGHDLPKVFFLAASNSVSTYDEALRDRLLHIYVPDIRKSFTARTHVKRIMIDELGMHPEVLKSAEMEELLQQEVLPMYDVLDSFEHKAATAGASSAAGKGHSIRHLIGQVRLREVKSKHLKDLINWNNDLAIQQGKAQFVILLSGKSPNPKYVKLAHALQGNAKLTEIQRQNLELNLSLIGMEEATNETLEGEGDDPLGN